MKTSLLTILIVFLNWCSDAQCLVNSIVINTAYNPVTGTALTPGTTTSPTLDPHWIITHATSTIPGAGAAGSPAFVIPGVGGAWVTNPAADPGGWISVLNSNTYNTYPDSTYNMTLGRPFRLCSDDSITFTLHIADDNYISVVDVDGSITLGFSQAAVASTTYFSTYAAYTQTVFLTAGTHTLNFLVNNYPTTTYSSNPTGLNVYGTVSSATASNSIVKESDTSCSSYVCAPIDTVCNTLAISRDSITLCDSGTVALSATVSGPDSIISIRWSPGSGFSDSTILNPTLHTGLTSRWYELSVASLMYGNLVYNGNFSLGNTGFSSSYTYSAPPSTILYEGDYSVYTDPYSVHTGFSSFGDHTTGTGNMLIVNGGATASDVWCQTVSVHPYTNYTFSAWVANASAVTTGIFVPIMQFKINGTLIGTPDTITASVGTWVKFTATWNSGASTTANICIYDALTASSGNDFALDDISFQEFCVATDSVYVSINVPASTVMSSDTTFCSNLGSITLTAPAGYANYLWSTGSTSASVTESGTGTYYVYCNGSCRSAIDTFNVNIIPFRQTTMITDTSFCFPGSVELTAPSGPGTLSWQDGSTGSHFTVTDPGTYYVNQSNYCADLVDSFHVAFSSLSVNLGPDTTVCMNYLMNVPVHGPDVSYLWQDGSRDSFYSADHTGTYYVTVKENQCVASDTVNVTFDFLSQNLPDTFICTGTPFSYILHVDVPEGGSMIWNDGVISPVRAITDSGTWWVYISKDQCKIIDTVHVYSGYCDCWYQVPGGFTPNNDGLNDVFRPTIQPGCTISGYLLTVYNRWGEQVFSSDVVNKGWDGVYKGTPADVDVYMYYIQFFIGVNNIPVKKSGTVTLIR